MTHFRFSPRRKAGGNFSFEGFVLFVIASSVGVAQTKPITLDEYLNTTQIVGARLSPDGTAAVIGTEAPDWQMNSFRHTLWLWTASGPVKGLRALTQSGSDENAEWSPDGKWIAFLSDRPLAAGDDTPAKDAGSGDAKRGRAGDAAEDRTTRVWLIPMSGGEAQPLYREKLDAHGLAWSTDGKTVYLAAMRLLSHAQEEARKDEWKDVIRWREQERGDLLLAVPFPSAVVSPVEHPAKPDETKPQLPASSKTLTESKLEITEIAPSPNGQSIAFLTTAISHRMESPADTEIYLVSSTGGQAKQLTHNQALESELHWSPDSRFLHFAVHAAGGSLDSNYQDVQGRLYRVSINGGKVERLGADFSGSLDNFEVMPDGIVIAIGLKGTESQTYRIEGSKAIQLPGRPGTYAGLSAPSSGHGLLMRHSSINHPAQVYLAADADHPDQLAALTDFNPIFAQRAQLEWQAYSWKSKDGVPVEGILVFPPGKKNATHLRMLTFIHGGPADADGNRFGADWYDWATMAATDGWLVFRPNYRGSTGYGDDFMLQIAPHLVSKPGEDILAGVDALVKEGFADPEKLAIGGYSYGGYMTNWLITETTRFKVAVTGAGAIEHAANWGNDDVTFDDAWYLNGTPWQAPELYQSEAALFRMNRVKTPTHIVQGASDVRVSYLEGVALERALQQLGVDHSFLVFPGEGHGLAHNPWHGYIKLREELKWLDKFLPK